MNVLARSLSSVVLLATCFGLSGCYTQLGQEPSRSDRYRIPAQPAAQPSTQAEPTAEASAPTWTGQARVGLGYEAGGERAQGDYAEYYGDEAYADETRAEGYYGDGEALGEGYYDDVQVTRYRYDDAAYSNYDEYGDYDYYGGSYGYDRYYDPYYVSYAPYYYPHRWQWYYLYSPYYPAPRWAYAYDPYFDVRYRRGWSVSVHIGSPYSYRPYYDPFYCDPFYSSYYYGYRTTYASYAHGYNNGYYDGYYSGGGYYGGGGYYSTARVRSPRGSVRSAIGRDHTRRRALLAYADESNDRVLLDSPLGVRNVRALSNDARQHVLAQTAAQTRVTRTATRTTTRTTDRTARVTGRTRAGEDVQVRPGRTKDRVGDRTADRTTDRIALPRGRDLVTRETGTSSTTRVSPRSERTPRATDTASRPKRRLGRPSRWSDDAKPRAPRRTEGSRAPATEQARDAKRTPPRQRFRRPATPARRPETRRPSTRPSPQRPAPRRTPATRSDDERRTAPATRPAPPQRTRPAPPPQRTRPAPPPQRSRPARPAPSRSGGNDSARPSRSGGSSSSARPSRSSGSSSRSSGRSSRRGN